MSAFQPAPTSHSFISQRLRLNYLDWGNPDAPTLVLQHGGRDHAHSWDWVARELQPDWHVVAPDLRGHGDSAWSPDGAYQLPYFIHDFAQFIEQLGTETVSIVAHSLGGGIATRYTGLYPDKVRRLVNVEGYGLSQVLIDARARKKPDEAWRGWIEERRGIATRQPRRYKNIEEAFARMRGENGFLSEAQAMHLTIHGISRNEDGSYSWKFDNYVHSFIPTDIPKADEEYLWSRVACPVLLAHGDKSWFPDPVTCSTVNSLRDAKIAIFEHSGHWPHHDEFDRFVHELRMFL